MRIYLDVDGVLANLVQKILDAYNFVHKTNWKHDQVTGWNMVPVMQEGQKWWDYTGLSTYQDVEPYPWARELVQATADTGLPWGFLGSLPIKQPGVLDARP